MEIKNLQKEGENGHMLPYVYYWAQVPFLGKNIKKLKFYFTHFYNNTKE